MSERVNSPDKQNASAKRPEQEAESPSKMMAPPPFALDASSGGGGGGGSAGFGGSSATGAPVGNLGLGLDGGGPS